MRPRHLADQRTRRWITTALLLAVCLAVPLAATAQKKSYTLDNDPMRLGNKALAAGRLDEAKAFFSEAVANDHHVTDALCGLAVVDLRQGNYADAEGRYRQALAASGGHDKKARAGLGLLLLRQGRNEEAASEFNEALREDNKLWEAHYGLARIAQVAGDWDTAREHLEFGRKARGLDEGEDKYQYGLALNLLGTGDISGAEHAALRAQVLNPTDPLFAQLVARIYLEEGHDSLALAAYEQALATPGFAATAPVLHQLGQLYATQNRFNEASDRYLQAVAADSTFAPAVKDLADLYRRAQRFDKAAGTYLRYVAIVPQDAQAQLNLSVCLIELGRFDEAADHARKAWHLAPDDSAARLQFARAGIHARADSLKAEAAALMTNLLNDPAADQPWKSDDLLALATWQSDRKDFAGADTTLERAAVLEPGDAHIPFQRGLVALNAGHPAEAADHFQQAVNLEPDGAANHLNLGIARYQAGQMEAAIPAFRQAVALRPNLAVARLLLAQVLAATGSLPEAESEYRQVLTQEPRNAKALRGVGFCRLRAADYSGAAAAYTQAADADPGNADGWAGLGSARLGQGDLAAAEAAFAKASAIDPQNIMLKTGTQLLNQAKNAGKDNQ